MQMTNAHSRPVNVRPLLDQYFEWSAFNRQDVSCSNSPSRAQRSRRRRLQQNIRLHMAFHQSRNSQGSKSNFACACGKTALPANVKTKHEKQ
jgi:hypothetical protein